MKLADFASFYQAVHGYPPFPWQMRLLQDVVETDWPEILSLPTASGKTSAIDVAVFALALQAERSLGERKVPLRIFFVIDRRVVVDEAGKHAERLAKALEDQSGIVGEVATRLKSFGGKCPLQVTVLRGGMYLDERWAEAPNQPTVCLTTVDQVGLRLLFRAYGLSSHQFPIHAGLVGNDALFIIDEAHLSQPFMETLQAVARYRTWSERPPGGPLKVMVMSATPPAGKIPFGLSAEDREHPVLKARLTAAKPALLDAQSAAGFEEALVRHALQLAKGDGVQVIGVIVNQVASARAIFDILRENHEAVLLTGRSRPYDRDQILKVWLPRMRVGRERTADRLLFVVATQTIEVGANVDFDALVTEAAPLDALRQRFGRLDRLGERGRSEAVIVFRKPEPGSGPDPVYGADLEAAWKWLKANTQGKGKKAFVDFGITAFEMLLAKAKEVPERRPVRAPVMLPAHLDLWIQTSPRPHPDPEIAPFLHGPEPVSSDVQIIWRADLSEGKKDWAESVAVAPPRQREALPVPIAAVRAWLRQEPAQAVGDLEGGRVATDTARTDTTRERQVLRWRGPENSEVIKPGSIRPGDTLVVPAAYGGADQFGWAPQLHRPVADLGDHCAAEYGRSVTARLRLNPALLKSWLADVPEPLGEKINESLEKLREAQALPETAGAVDDLLETLLQQLAEALDGQPLLAEVVYALQRARKIKLIPYAGESVVLVSGGSVDFTDEDDTSSLTRPVPLTEHGTGVGCKARQFAEACGLPPGEVSDLGLAGDLHDVGKADPRFQIMLHGGDELAAAGAETLLAKSGMNPADVRALRLARQRAGLPRGFRHELVSVALVAAEAKHLASAQDPELVRYLIGTHHGRARPFPPRGHR